MKKIIALILGAFALYSCVDDNYHDSGLANGRYDGTVWEYMHSNHEWDSAIVVIERAGLVGIFDGSDPAYKDGITFFGFTNFTVWQFLAYTKQGGHPCRIVPPDGAGLRDSKEKHESKFRL